MLASNVEKLLKALHDEGVEFVIIGGAAAVLHGSAYVTGDLDICYSRERENLKKVATALAPFNPSLRGAPKNLPFHLDVDSLKAGRNFTLTTDLGDLDLLGEVTGLGGYGEALSFSEELEIFGMSCKVLTLQGLIKNKRAVGRAKDLRLLPELEALLEIRKSQKKG
ncbi:MAG: nucleotidyltransferase [Deltaproteobacteria bacterium]|nr:nucleotidyltransferase [Deltaproteobacteria bacterium]